MNGGTEALLEVWQQGVLIMSTSLFYEVGDFATAN